MCHHRKKLRTLNIIGAFSVLVSDRIQKAISRQSILSTQESIALIQIGLFSPTFHNLQTTLQLTQSATSRLVNKLVEKQFIIKDSSSDDLREKSLRLTNKSEQLVNEILSSRYESLESMLHTLTPEETSTFLKIISKILEHSIQCEIDSDITCRMCDLCHCPQDKCPAQPNKDKYILPDHKK